MGRVALITGGGSGIGRGIALALARRGADLALVGRRAARLEEVAGEARLLGVRAAAFPTDLASPVERAALVERVHASPEIGGRPITILVHSAAVFAGGDLSNLTQGDIERAVAVNLAAPADLTRLFLPDLRRAPGRSSVVLVGSGAALVPLPAAPLYSATKAGVRALAASLRYELRAKRVHLLVAYPPATATAMTEGMAQRAGLPHFRLAQPEDVGDRIVRALAQRKRELYISPADRLLRLLNAVAPSLLHAILYSQRARFVRMTTDDGRQTTVETDP